MTDFGSIHELYVPIKTEHLDEKLVIKTIYNKEGKLIAKDFKEKFSKKLAKLKHSDLYVDKLSSNKTRLYIKDTLQYNESLKEVKLQNYNVYLNENNRFDDNNDNESKYVFDWFSYISSIIFFFIPIITYYITGYIIVSLTIIGFYMLINKFAYVFFLTYILYSPFYTIRQYLSARKKMRSKEFREVCVI